MKESEIRTVKIFKALGSPTRFKIIQFLSKKEKTPSELANQLNKTIATISKHLKILRDLDIVQYRTEYYYVYYSLKKKEILKLIESADSIVSR